MNPGDIVLCLQDTLFHDNSEHYAGNSYKLDPGDEQFTEECAVEGRYILLHGLN